MVISHIVHTKFRTKRLLSEFFCELFLKPESLRVMKRFNDNQSQLLSLIYVTHKYMHAIDMRALVIMKNDDYNLFNNNSL